MKRTLPALLLALLTLVAPRPAVSTTVARASLSTLAQAAQRITHARVVEARCAEESDGLVWTTYTLETVEELKDGGVTTGARFTVRQVGGKVGKRRLVAIGLPHFTVGEEAVLFTSPGGDAALSILNGAQGALKVERDAAPSGEGEAGTARLPAAATWFPDAATSELHGFKAAVRATLAATP